jgi:DNA-binding MarR family transcriptional regulator
MLAQVTAIRRGKAPIGIIHMVDDLKPVSNPVTNRSLGPLTQSVASQDLGAALDALSRSAALTAADVQRQVEIIARAAIRLGQRLNSINHSASTQPIFSELDDPVLDQEPSLDVANTIAALRRIIRERRVRERFFKEVRFGEPAWDIILDLTLAWFEGKSVAVSSLCIASGVPMSTAMRWINDMIEAGLINRWIDPVDGRRNLMQISPATRDAMLRYLVALNVSESSVSQSSPEAGVLGSRSH